MAKTKQQHLFDLSMEVEACSRCPYAQSRQQPLMGNGEIRSPILVLLPAVRQRDDQDNTVLAGRAGDKLEKLLKGAGLSSNKVFRTPLIRCYAGREPNFHEFAAFKRCRSYTVSMIKFMRPPVIVLCGLKVLKWMVVKWTREHIDEVTFPRWIGRAVRLKDIWGETKFFVIEDPAQLARVRNVEAELKSIEALQTMKAYIAGLQKTAPVVALDMIDLKRRTHAKAEQQKFDWGGL